MRREPDKVKWVDIPSCPICGSTGRTPFHKFVIDKDHSFVRCARCDVIYLAPRPEYDAEFLEEWYECESEHGKPLFTGDHREHSGKYYHGLDLMEQAESLHPGRGRMLDVGCQAGDLLLVAMERGWEGRGADIAQRMVEFCAQRGVEAECVDITSTPFDGEGFDLVTACHVLEHSLSPLDFIKAIKDRTADDGLIVLEVPNIMGADARFKRLLERIGLRKTPVHSPHHLYEFTYRALENLAERAGLEVIARYTYSAYRSRPGIFKKLYQSLLKRVWMGGKFRVFMRKTP